MSNIFISKALEVSKDLIIDISKDNEINGVYFIDKNYISEIKELFNELSSCDRCLIPNIRFYNDERFNNYGISSKVCSRCDGGILRSSHISLFVLSMIRYKYKMSGNYERKN